MDYYYYYYYLKIAAFDTPQAFPTQPALPVTQIHVARGDG